MHSAYVVGIDIGTGSVKAVAMDALLQVVGTHQVFYPASESDTEQDVEIAFQCFADCLADLVRATGGQPTAICLSAAMHSLLAVDAEGRPLMKALLWSDNRSANIAERLRGTEEGNRLYEATGTPIHSMSPLCKLKWLQEADAKLFRSAARFLSIKEYVWWRLFGEYSIDHSLASATGLFNTSTLEWEPEAVSFVGLETSRLSQPVPTSHHQHLPSATAASLGIPAHTCFYIGGSDGCLANLGSLCLDAETAAVTIGTSGALRITSKLSLANPQHMLFNYRLNEETFVCGGAINNGGNLLQWMVDALFEGAKGNDFDALFSAVQNIPAGSEGLLCLPYLHGERAPIWDEKSCGVFFSVQPHHTKAHFARAVLEGMAFAFKSILAAIEEQSPTIKRVVFSGGLSQSAVMAQLLADVLAKEVAVYKTADSAAMGAAYMAGLLVGFVDDYQSIPPHSGQTFSPNKTAVETFEKMHRMYTALYPALKDLMHQHHQSFSH